MTKEQRRWVVYFGLFVLYNLFMALLGIGSDPWWEVIVCVYVVFAAVVAMFATVFGLLWVWNKIENWVERGD